jgi:hypothetical protein
MQDENKLARHLILEYAGLLAQQATYWAAQARHAWFWRGIPGTGY